MAEKVVSLPAAARTLHALRDLGYDMNSAVADVVDNSISRGRAKNIRVYFGRDKQEKFHVWICDDGVGMSSDELKNAMQLGSSNNYVRGDLSKYGMGLKTASLSQASKLTVLSKRKRYHTAGYSWDMYHVNKVDRWEMFRLDKREISKTALSLVANSDAFGAAYFKKLFSGQSWTVVIWEDLKEFQSNHDSYESGVTANNYYYRELEKLSLYLRMVFGRFISGENSARKINLFLGNRKLTAFDPFCRNERHTLEIPLTKKHGNFLLDHRFEPIRIRRYVLPTNPARPGEFKFSKAEAWEEAKGNLSWNESQGFYVYRNNRLINWGGWYKTKTLDEHDKLARASIDLSDEHDSLFKLDVKKTKIQFPESLKNHLQDNVNKGFIAQAKTRYAGSERGIKKKIASVLRQNEKKVNSLASSLVRAGHISVVQNGEDRVIINNKNGKRISLDMTFRELEAGQKVISRSFGTDELFWKMVPSPDSKFQVLVNEDHPFYKIVYGNGKKDKKTMAIVDAFVFTMSFVELKCITTSNEFLFDQMREVASAVLRKIVKEKIL